MATSAVGNIITILSGSIPCNTCIIISIPRAFGAAQISDSIRSYYIRIVLISQLDCVEAIIDSKWIGDLFRRGFVKGEFTRYRYKLVPAVPAKRINVRMHPLFVMSL